MDDNIEVPEDFSVDDFTPQDPSSVAIQISVGTKQKRRVISRSILDPEASGNAGAQTEAATAAEEERARKADEAQTKYMERQVKKMEKVMMKTEALAKRHDGPVSQSNEAGVPRSNRPAEAMEERSAACLS